MTTEIDAAGLDAAADALERMYRGRDSQDEPFSQMASAAITAYLATTRTSEAEPVAVTIDREALRKRIENDPDEGEIGAGFEMFTPEAEVALERMAFAALPRWAQDELTALRAAATLTTTHTSEAEPVAWMPKVAIDVFQKCGADERLASKAWSYKATSDAVALYTLPTPASDDRVEADYFGSLVDRARTAAAKASVKFPQPNYVTLKIAEEAGEVVRGAVHYAENRMEWSEVEGEIVQLLAMLIRFVTDGDQINGVTPPAALAAMGSTKP